MATLRIESWAEDQRWAGEQSWSLKTFAHRLSLCTSLRGTELKRTARGLMKKELLEVNDVDPAAVGALVHALESLGAKIVLA